MYEELKKKCEVLSAEIMALENEKFRGPLDFKELKLSERLNAAASELDHLANTIEVYFNK